MQTETVETVQVADAFSFLYEPSRYKIAYGGRGGAKSWQYADAALVRAQAGWERILCTREFQSSIADSVYRLLLDRISAHGWDNYFDITLNKIICKLTGAEFIFKGLHHNINEIKSTEGVTIAWVEEAQSVSKDSWDILIPTIRTEGSEIWVSFNTGAADDPTYTRFVLNAPPEAAVKKVGWQDNPWFPDVLNRERLYCQRVDPDAYDHIWEGMPKTISDACIFKGKYRVMPFETPADARFYYGADWGFSVDPTVLIRCFIKANNLYIDYEAYGVGVELDEIPALFDTVPGSRKWIIRADNSRPETISYIKKKGFRIIPAVKKWKANNVEDKFGMAAAAAGQSSIEDGIAYMRKFEEIIIHERCKHTADEFKLYSYKVDKLTEDVLPVIVDAFNHCIDSTRYALEPLIKGGVDWESLVN